LFSETHAFLDSVNRYETVLVAAHRNPLLTSNGTRRVADLTFEEAAGGFDIIPVAIVASRHTLESLAAVVGMSPGIWSDIQCR
jgi:hypothetical protein